jgi:isoquinoline 1-oxidoreductase beta subunit
MNQMPRIDRRSFLVGSAVAGLSLGFHVPFAPLAGAQDAPEINAWVVIEPDDTVIIRIARSEMGQGTLTGLAQMVAEELECDWSKVTTEYPTPGQSIARKNPWGDFSTGGSRGIRSSQEYVRKGGAAARIMLIAAAANEWKVPASECTAANSVITHKPSNRSTTYGKVAAAAALIEPPKDVQLKDPKDWRIIGKSVKRLDTRDKTTGKMVYGIDVKLPGMLNATIKACPVFGGKLKSFDADKIASMRGVVKVLPVGDKAVAVVADTWWHAKTALEALPIVWDNGENAKVSSESIAQWLKEGLDAEQAFIGNQSGDVKAGLAAAAKTVVAEYAYPYQNHACMEPLNATALYTPDKCEVWCGTQNGQAAFAAALEASGLPASKVEVYKIMLGGGFGRRGRTDYVTQAVLIAKQMPGTPIKLLWSREEDMLHGSYHPVTQCRLTAGLDDKGNLTTLHARISGQSILTALRPEALQNGMDPVTFQGFAPSGDAMIGYSIPNILIDHSMRNPHVPPFLARRQRQPERHLSRVLYGRGRQGSRRRSIGISSPTDGQPSQAPRRTQRGGGRDRVEQAGAARSLSWTSPAHGLRQLCGGRRGSLRRRGQSEDTPHRRRDRSGLRRQSGSDRTTDHRLIRLRFVGAVLWRMHGQGRSHGADQFRQLQLDGDRRNAEGGVHYHADRRVLGRRWRADYLRGASGRPQRDRRGDRQALSLGAAEKPRS